MKQGLINRRWNVLLTVLLTLAVGISAGCRSSPPPGPQPQRSEAERLMQTGRRQFDAGAMEAAIRSYRLALEAARTADEREAVSRIASNLAVALAATGQWSEARRHARLAQAEAQEATIDRWTAELIEARIAWLQDDFETAGALAENVWLAPGVTRYPGLRTEAGVLTAQVFLERDRIDAAIARLDAARTLMPADASFALRAVWQGTAGRIAMQDDRPLDAATAFDRQASHWRNAARYEDMALALEAGGHAWLAVDRPRDAADRYFRAGRSLDAMRPTDAQRLLQLARDLAVQVDDVMLLERIDSLLP